jgi:hypothetical protein
VNPIFIYIVLLVRVIVDRERRLAGPEWPLNGQKGEEVDEERERERQIKSFITEHGRVSRIATTFAFHKAQSVA